MKLDLENIVTELESSEPLEVLCNFSITQYFHFPSPPENPYIWYQSLLSFPAPAVKP
jgi:hypothetical protein